MKNIFICEFLTGEYGNRQEIPLCAFSSKEDALNFCAEHNRRLMEEGVYVTQESASSMEDFEIDGEKHFVETTGAQICMYSLELKG